MGIGNFALFCSSGLDLDPMTFVYELDQYYPKMHPQTKNELFSVHVKAFESYRIRADIQSHRTGGKDRINLSIAI